jgi:hypothetical protein
VVYFFFCAVTENKQFPLVRCVMNKMLPVATVPTAQKKSAMTEYLQPDRI